MGNQGGVVFIHVKGHSNDLGNDKADDRVQWGKAEGPYCRFAVDGTFEGDYMDQPRPEHAATAIDETLHYSSPSKRFNPLQPFETNLPEQFWRLPWEKWPLVGSDFDAMLTRSLARRGMSPPPGFVYTIHSTRAGSLSEGAALGVPLSRLKHMGGYSPTSTVPEDKYIDPSCPPSPAGRHFFGWLLPSALPLSA
eukprot:COSAG05_NODE_344_length_11005_cov_35.313772_12_plen_194_part_00